LIESGVEEKIRKGVIAAGGWSTRFLPAVKTFAKQMVPVLDRPGIQYLVEEMIGAGIEEIAIVHRHGEGSIKRYFQEDKELEEYLRKTGKGECMKSWKEVMKGVKKWRFIPQGRSLPYGNATPILSAKGFIGNDPFVYMFGDDFILEKKTGEYLSQLIKVFEKYRPGVVLGVQEVSRKEIEKYGSVAYAKDDKYPNRIKQILEKLPLEKALSDMAQFGRFVISNDIFGILKRLKLGIGGELWLTDANNMIAREGVAIAEPIKNGEWITTGDPLRWLKVNIKMAWKEKGYRKELKKIWKELD
jgi:UTP--glucose-1-phosphate uridylyltransferase